MVSSARVSAGVVRRRRNHQVARMVIRDPAPMTATRTPVEIPGPLDDWADTGDSAGAGVVPLDADGLMSMLDGAAPVPRPALTAPWFGSATYGKAAPKALSLVSTLSPAASASTSLPVCAAPST